MTRYFSKKARFETDLIVFILPLNQIKGQERFKLLKWLYLFYKKWYYININY